MKYGVKQLFVIGFDNELDMKIWKKLRTCWYWHNVYCYDNMSARYSTYGKLGWKLCSEWDCNNPKGLINFYNWGKQFLKTEQDLSLVLDKDLLDNGQKIMRPESCRWVTGSENTREKNLRYKKQQRQIMIKIGKANKGKKFKISEEDKKRRSEQMKKLNQNKDYEQEALKISNTLKKYWKKKKQEQ